MKNVFSFCNYLKCKTKVPTIFLLQHKLEKMKRCKYGDT